MSDNQKIKLKNQRKIIKSKNKSNINNNNFDLNIIPVNKTIKTQKDFFYLSSYENKNPKQDMNPFNNTKFTKVLEDYKYKKYLESFPVNDLIIKDFFPKPKKIINENDKKKMRKKKNQEFLEKISFVNKPNMTKSANNFNQNRGLFKLNDVSRLKIINTMDLKNAKYISDDFLTTERDIGNNFIYTNKIKINNHQTNISNSNPVHEYDNLMKDHYLRMMKIVNPSKFQDYFRPYKDDISVYNGTNSKFYNTNEKLERIPNKKKSGYGYQSGNHTIDTINLTYEANTKLDNEKIYNENSSPESSYIESKPKIKK
jgi:hypothetical protein